MLKKIILFWALTLSMLPLFFHRAAASEVKPVKAPEVEIKTLFYDTYLEENHCFYLNSGYYLMSEYNDISREQILGDIEFYTFDGYPEDDLQDYYQGYDYDEDDVPILNELFRKFGEWTEGYLTYNLIIVKSCAVLKNETGDHYGHFTVMYAPKEPENKNLTFIGNKTHIVNVDNFISIENLKARYTANDNVDGDVTSTMTFSTNYNPNNKTLGRYYFVAVATDRAGHKTISLDYVVVIDFTPPVLSLSQDIIKIEVFTPFTSNDAKALFSATDNFVSQDELTLVVNDQYRDNYNTLGTYYFTAYTTDGTNKSQEKKLTIIVQDTTKPTIKLKNNLDKIVADHQLSNEELLEYFVVEDNYDHLSKENLKVVENNCNGQEGKDFIIKIKATDLSGNETIKEFKYYLLDTKAPTITVKDTIFLDDTKSYTNEQIIELLRENGILDFEVVSTKWQLIKENSYELIYEVTFENETQEKKVLINIAKKTTSEKSNTHILIISVGTAICAITLLSLLLIRKKKHGS